MDIGGASNQQNVNQIQVQMWDGQMYNYCDLLSY